MNVGLSDGLAEASETCEMDDQQLREAGLR
jgi:hypothetical protein